VENRSVIVTLFKDDASQNQVPEGGSIASNNLTGPRIDMQFSDFTDVFEEDKYRPNIPAGQYPSGEIRGHIINLL